jgi:hypothetical protein
MIERTKIEKTSRIHVKSDKRAEELSHTLDSELDKTRARDEVAE